MSEALVPAVTRPPVVRPWDGGHGAAGGDRGRGSRVR